MLFDISFLADWNKNGDHRQHCTDLNTDRERSRRDKDYKVGDEVFLIKHGTAPTYCQSLQEPQGVPYAWFY